MSDHPLDRRRFLARAAALGATMLIARRPIAWAAPDEAADAELRIALLAPSLRSDDVDAAVRGARLGAEEAARTAALFGRNTRLEQHAYDAADDAARAAVRAIDDGARALVGGFDEAACDALAAVATERGVPFLNVGSGADALRGERCRAAMLHVAPSDAMRADALAALRANASGQEATGARVRIEAWHPALERFGAAQLNDRHRARYGVGMTAAAWCGWVAVKIAADAALRGAPGAPLLARLLAPAAQFDGHKGAPLSFRPWDRQLRQPLYAVALPDEPAGDAPGRVIAELPAARPGVPARTLLDELGTDAARSRCARAATAAPPPR